MSPSKTRERVSWQQSWKNTLQDQSQQSSRSLQVSYRTTEDSPTVCRERPITPVSTCLHQNFKRMFEKPSLTLRSRWTMFLLCKYSIPFKIWVTMARASASEKFPCSVTLLQKSQSVSNPSIAAVSGAPLQQFSSRRQFRNDENLCGCNIRAYQTYYVLVSNLRHGWSNVHQSWPIVSLITGHPYLG